MTFYNLFQLFPIYNVKQTFRRAVIILLVLLRVLSRMLDVLRGLEAVFVRSVCHWVYHAVGGCVFVATGNLESFYVFADLFKSALLLAWRAVAGLESDIWKVFF